jgi:beta-galactosidase
MYKNGEFVQEFRKEDSPYPYLPHGPLVVDDFVGDVLVTKEGMKPRQAREVKKIMNDVARVGLNNLSLETKLAAAKLIATKQITMERATELYNKYVGDWGGTSTAYRFDAIKDGKVVKTVEKQPMHGLKLFGGADHVALKEDQTYDVAAVRIQMQDEFGNLLSFCNDPVTFEVQGEIELVGPSIVAFQGGMTGTYVKTLGKSGSGKLIVKSQGAEPLELEFTIEA